VDDRPSTAPPAHPTELAALLSAEKGPASESAWRKFLSANHELLMRTAYSVAKDHDVAMDLYTRGLEHLRRDDFRKLRAYDPRVGRFATWLSVVIRRLFLDLLRERYGRRAPGVVPGVSAEEERAERRRLVDLVGEELREDHIPGSAANPEVELRRRQLSERLAGVVAGLPAEDRLLLKLRYERELTGRQIMKLMEFPTVFHVYRRVNYILGRLRERLQRAGVTDAAP
jgi:RNA polymerase sigma factor (sigma-70 family)